VATLPTQQEHNETIVNIPYCPVVLTARTPNVHVHQRAGPTTVLTCCMLSHAALPYKYFKKCMVVVTASRFPPASPILLQRVHCSPPNLAPRRHQGRSGSKSSRGGCHRELEGNQINISTNNHCLQFPVTIAVRLNPLKARKT
jgi:hypothetical protein